jgi:hypothetical protein
MGTSLTSNLTPPDAKLSGDIRSGAKSRPKERPL